jgi:hypothetical protein
MAIIREAGFLQHHRSNKVIFIKQNDTRPIPASLGKLAVLASAIVMVAALGVTSAYASANSCNKTLGRCQSTCSKRPIGQDVCYKRCERTFMNCD